MQDDLKPLLTYPNYETLIKSILIECRKIEQLPSGGKNVSDLMPLLKELDSKLSQWLNEARVWDSPE